MFRVKRGARLVVAVALLLVLVLMFLPPARNVLTMGYMPRLWRSYPTWRILKAQIYSGGSTEATLQPCTEPERETSKIRDHHDPVQQLLVSKPYKKVQARSEDEAAYSKALAWLNSDSESKRRYSKFSPKLSLLDKARLVLTWRIMHEAFTLHNITYFLIDGTLLGTMRHGGIIPWDDEMDIGVEEKDAGRAQRVLSCIPGYVLRVQVGLQMKFFSQDAQPMKHFSQSPVQDVPVLNENEKKTYVMRAHPFNDVIIRVPFIDIFVLRTDGSFLWSAARFNQWASFYPVEDVYPLTLANFEGYSAPVPRHSALLTNRIFDANKCVSNNNDHFLGQEVLDIMSVPCAELAEMYTVYEV